MMPNRSTNCDHWAVSRQNSRTSLITRAPGRLRQGAEQDLEIAEDAAALRAPLVATLQRRPSVVEESLGDPHREPGQQQGVGQQQKKVEAGLADTPVAAASTP